MPLGIALLRQGQRAALAIFQRHQLAGIVQIKMLGDPLNRVVVLRIVDRLNRLDWRGFRLRQFRDRYPPAFQFRFHRRQLTQRVHGIAG